MDKWLRHLVRCRFLFDTERELFMAKVLNVVESDVKQIHGKTVQRVIFSDDKIVYVDVYTGEVRPDSTPDKYVDLISVYNASNHRDTTIDEICGDTHDPLIQTNISEKAAHLRRTAAHADLLFVILIGLLGIIFLMNGGFFIVLLVWMIPMTVMAYNSVDDSSDKTALGVCHLIFFNIISGILLLASNKYIND